MNLETSYEPENEEITMVLDDSIVLKASLGDRSELILNEAFIDLENDNELLYIVLKRFSRELFKLTDV